MVLHERLEKYRIILGSASPRRKQLMEDLGLNLVVDPVMNVDESFPSHLGKSEIPVYLAEFKSLAYPRVLEPGEILLTADTIVWIENQVIGKPAGREDAISMLQQLSGRCHEVLTGVMLRSANHKKVFFAHSLVYFKELSNEEISYYVDTYQPYDKAGSYGIQEYIGYIGIEKIDGSFYNVMGLPVQMVCSELCQFADIMEQKNRII